MLIRNVTRRLSALSRWHLERHVLRMFLRPEYSGKVGRYGNWMIPESILGPSSICYCAGVGEDLELEKTLMANYGASVYAFDPTPRAINYVERSSLDQSRFEFMAVGLWSEDTTLRFYAPDDPLHVSHSVVENDTDRSFFDAPCKKLSTLMKHYGHTHIDLLKMNIEGAEYEVLRAMMDDKIQPRSICLTFEGAAALRLAIQWTKRLRHYGYELAGLHKWAATFVLKSDRTITA